MKNKSIKSFLFGAAMLFGSLASFAQFTGTIEFSKHVGSIDVNYKYYVNGDNVRVEEIGDGGSIDGIQIMDLESKTMYALSPERKMYMETPNKRTKPELDLEIEKTGKTKTINGVKCQEIIVISKERDRKIQYWVAKGDYDFFIPMLETLNRKENQSMFYLEIPDMEGMFPMESTEYTLSDGTVVSKLEVENIAKGKVDGMLFEIPADYSKFER